VQIYARAKRAAKWAAVVPGTEWSFSSMWLARDGKTHEWGAGY